MIGSYIHKKEKKKEKTTRATSLKTSVHVRSRLSVRPARRYTHTGAQNSRHIIHELEKGNNIK
jgi:hypothetical protein